MNETCFISGPTAWNILLGRKRETSMYPTPRSCSITFQSGLLPSLTQVTSAIRAPSNWTPMNLYDVECKLMEARKYSHEYYDVESKFRHRQGCQITPSHFFSYSTYSSDFFDGDVTTNNTVDRNLQLITAYGVQNPFLLGCFMLRKEQLSLQLPHKASAIPLSALCGAEMI